MGGNGVVYNNSVVLALNNEEVGKRLRVLYAGPDFTPDHVPAVLKLLDEHGGVRNLEVRFRMKSGEIRTMLWSAELMDYKGDACLIVVAHDVTEKLQLENDLLKSQAKLYQKHAELKTYLARVESVKQEWEWTLNCIDQMVILGDRDGRIKRSNRAFQEFVGLGADQLVGLDWAELLHAYELTTGTIFLRSMELFHRPSGRWFVLNPYQFREGAQEEVAGTVVTIHDLILLNYPTERATTLGPLIQRAVDSWFVQVTAFRDRMVELDNRRQAEMKVWARNTSIVLIIYGTTTNTSIGKLFMAGIVPGILPITHDEAGLAAVLGHEIGHVLARHGGERLSQQMGVQTATQLLAGMASSNPATVQLVSAALGAGAQVGVLLPFSRQQESEADHLGPGVRHELHTGKSARR